MTQNIYLDEITSNQGFKIHGSTNGDESGSSVSSAGDFNGDGYDDIIIGAPKATPNSRANAGISYVVFGGNFSTNIELSSLALNKGFSILGANAGDKSGYSVSGIGDINNDGFADIAIGAPYASPNSRTMAGITYIIFGKNEVNNIDLAVQQSRVISVAGEAEYDYCGYSVSSAGDMNKDGFSDIVIGSPGADVISYSAGPNGRAYVIFGNSLTHDIDLLSLATNQGFTMRGEGGFFGSSVSTAGDVNGDGYADIIIGANLFDLSYSIKDAGRSYVLFGGSSLSSIYLTQLTITKGFYITGGNGAKSGFSVSGIGDFNNDGYSDIIIGAPASDGRGRACVLFGNKTIYSLESPGGKYCISDGQSDSLGYSVSGARDVNKDGYDDIVIGEPFAYGSTTDSGKSYVIFGSNSKILPSIVYGNVQLHDGFNIGGANTYDSSGRSLSGAGDINGDGYADIIIGSPLADPNSKASAGASYVVFGSISPTSNPTVVPTFKPTVSPTLQPVYTKFALFEDIYIQNGENVLTKQLTPSTAIVVYSKGQYDFAYGQVFDSSLAKAGNEIALSSGFGVDKYAYGWKVKAASIETLQNKGFVFTWQNVGSNSQSTNYILYRIFDQNNNPIATDSVANQGSTNRESLNPSVVALNNGGFTITWQSYGLYSSSSSQFDITGKSFDQYGSLISSGSSFGTTTISGIQSNPSTIKLDNGNFVLAWFDQNAFGIYAKLYNSNMNTIKSDFKVNTFTRSTDLTYPIALSLGSQFIITWESKGQDGSDFGIFGQLYSNTGNKIGSEFQVNTYTDGFQGNHYSSKLNQDIFAIVWESKINQPTYHVELKGQLFSNNADKIGQEFRVNSYNTNSRGYPSIAALGDENFVVSWSGEGLNENSVSYGVFIKFFDTNTVKNGNYNPDHSTNTNQPTLAPAPSPTYVPTTMPTHAITIISGATYNGSSMSENFIIDVSSDILINGGGGGDMYTLEPHPDVLVTISDFNQNKDKINLKSFNELHSFNELNITAGSIIITLESNQKMKLLNLQPYDINEENFIFAENNNKGKDSGTSDHGGLLDYGIYAGIGVAALALSGCLLWWGCCQCSSNKAVPVEPM